MIERRKITRERRRNIAVGMTGILALAGLAFLLFSFGYLPGFLHRSYTVTLELDSASGLHDSSRVTLAGYQVGTVARVELVPGRSGEPTRAKAYLHIRDEIDLPENLTVRVETPIFGGGPAVVLMPDGPSDAVLPKDGSAQLPRPEVVNALMQLEIVGAGIGELQETWGEVGGHINAMFDDSAGRDTPNLPRMVLAMEHRLEQLSRVLEGVERWAGDERLYEDVTQTATNLHELSKNLDDRVAGLEARYLQLADALSGTAAQAGETLAQAGSSMQALERRVIALADDASQTMAVIDELVAQASAQDSTLGLLLNDPSLYENLDDTAERLQLLVDEARLLIAKWKAEGLPLNIFD